MAHYSPYTPYIPIILSFVIMSGVIALVLVLNYVFGPKRRIGAKGIPFECGLDSIGTPRRRFSVKYYLVGIFFIVFDIETVFLLPWAVQYRQLLSDPAIGIIALIEVIIFVAVLAFGLAYVWRKGALDWN